MSRVRRALAFAALALWAALAAWPAGAQGLVPVPALSARVTDLTGTLSDAQRADLERRMAAIEARKGAQLAILMLPTTAPEAIEPYSIRVAESWKLGRGKVDGKSVDDGVLVVVAKDDRKVRIEVGYGLEGAIPDALAKRVIAQTIVPRFREGRFFEGLAGAVDDLGRLIEGEPLPAPEAAAGNGGAGDWVGTLMAVVVAGFVATAVLGKLLGASAGGAGAIVASMLHGASLLLALAFGVLAFVFFLVFASTGSGLRPRSRGRGSVWTTGGGLGGGGFGRGGFGGGGFGGGGGGFGGGGASGNW